MNNRSNIFKEFILFLKNNNIMSTIIATVLSTHVTELTTSFADNIILPIIYRDGNRDGKSDVKEIETYILKVKGIDTRPIFYPMNEMPAFASYIDDSDCPVSHEISYSGLSLPSSLSISKDEVRYVVDSVLKFFTL